jgi:hypothetical protein
MRVSALIFLVFFLLISSPGTAQQSTPNSNDIQIELAQENEFVVKMMDVINKSGKRIPKLIELDSFSIEEKLFIFKNSNRKLQKISDKEIKKIVFNRLRQGVLTGKPSSLRVIAWNGKIKNFELDYRDLKIKDGYLFLSQNEVSKHFDDSDTLRANSQEWSDKLNEYWARIKAESPEVFAANFAFQDGRGIMTRKIAVKYCKACVKLEILNMQINPENETIEIRCKDVFYDKYNE